MMARSPFHSLLWSLRTVKFLGNFIRWTNINVIYPFSTRQRVTRALRTTISYGHANLILARKKNSNWIWGNSLIPGQRTDWVHFGTYTNIHVKIPFCMWMVEKSIRQGEIDMILNSYKNVLKNVCISSKEVGKLDIFLSNSELYVAHSRLQCWTNKSLCTVIWRFQRKLNAFWNGCVRPYHMLHPTM